MAPKLVDLALTCKVNSNLFGPNLLKVIYERYLYEIRKLCKVVYLVYELDSSKKLHIHAHIQTPTTTKYNQFKISPLHVYVKPITNLAGWYKYMNKDPFEVIPRYIRRIDKGDYSDGNNMLDFMLSLKEGAKPEGKPAPASTVSCPTIEYPCDGGSAPPAGGDRSLNN